MCLIAFAWKVHPDHPLIVAANRDEFHERPADSVHWWPGMPGILAGRDRRAGGTWMGVHRRGRFAAVTNLRTSDAPDGTRSRGTLVTDFLAGDEPPQACAERVFHTRHQWSPFNLLVGDGQSLWYAGSHSDGPMAISPGVHCLSNHLLNTPWPKVARSCERLQKAIQTDGLESSLFEMLADTLPAPDETLPDTGVGLETERILSPPFIITPRYGTRCSTVLMTGPRTRMIERRFNPAGQSAGQICHEFWCPKPV